MSQEEIKDLFNDLSKEESSSAVVGAQIIGNTSDDLLLGEVKKESKYGEYYDRRDGLYADMLEHYLAMHKSKARWNRWFKLAFFVITMLAFIALIGAPMAAIVIIAIKGNVNWKHVALVVTGLGGIITSIIVLPKIIAEHLFPTNEDQYMIGMVQNMQKNDAQIRSSSHDKRSGTTDQNEKPAKQGMTASKPSKKATYKKQQK